MTTTLDRLQSLKKAAKSDPASFDSLKFLETVAEMLQEACDVGGEYDAIGPDARYGQGCYFDATDFLCQNGFVSAAEQLLFGWRNNISTRQLGEQKHIYQAGNAYKLTQMYLRIGDLGAALRWALLTQADDLLSEHSGGGGAGKQWLRTVFGATEADLNVIKSIADENIGVIKSEISTVSKSAWFAEDAVVRLALRGTALGHLFWQPSATQEFPISSPYFKTLLQQVNASNSSNKEKGDTLEILAFYLFLLIPSWFPIRNVLDKDKGFESDIIVSNLNPASNLTAELLGRHFLVECKNWKKPVRVNDIGYFLYRMRLTHCNFGIIFASNGITGKEEGETASRSLIRRAFHEDGNTCIVLDKNDLEMLSRCETGFWPMLLRKIQQIRFGGAR